MKKKIYYILLLFCIASTILLQAQSVGIQTTQPQGIFHVDPKQDTSGSINTSDDVVVDSSGRLGIGEINPQQRVDIDGTFQLMDGTQALNRVLVSDNLGRASWGAEHFNSISVWTLNSPSGGIDIANTSTIFPLSGTGSISGDIIPGFTATENYITIPAGTYIIMMHGGLETKLENGVQKQFRAYGRFSLVDKNNSAEINVLFTPRLNGNSFLYKTSDKRDITINYSVRNLNSYIGIYENAPYTAVMYSISLIFIKL